MAKFNCQTLPGELRSKQNERWYAYGAIAELVDNSFGPKRGNADEVVISYDPRARVLDILDDGRGMDHIGRLFQGGNSIGRGVGDIGEYGAGGSKALLWLAAKVEIWTMRGDGMVMFDDVVWKEWIAAPSFDNLGVSDDWVRARNSNTPAPLLAIGHGTLIRLHLMPKRKIDGSKIRHELARIYSPGLRRGKRIAWHTVRKNDIIDTVVLTDTFIAPSPHIESISFDLVIGHDGNALPVTGLVTYDETTTQADSKLQIGYNYRIIRSVTECFQSADGSESYTGVGVSGWLDLGDAWRAYLTTTKEGIDHEILFDDLMGFVFEKIKPLLKKSQQKMYEMQFDDLALGLERALNERGGGSVTFMVQSQTMPEFERGDGITEDGPDRPTEEKPPGSTEKKAPPRLTIKLWPQSDHAMCQHLCRSEIRDKDMTIIVYINEEHSLIEEAMRQKPINKMLLNSVVVNELSSELAQEQFETFIETLFRSGDAKSINEIVSPRDRARTLQRKFMDRVRSPLTAAPPPEMSDAADAV